MLASVAGERSGGTTISGARQIRWIPPLRAKGARRGENGSKPRAAARNHSSRLRGVCQEPRPLGVGTILKLDSHVATLKQVDDVIIAPRCNLSIDELFACHNNLPVRQVRLVRLANVVAAPVKGGTYSLV
jgi:hypothetical protein